MASSDNLSGTFAWIIDSSASHHMTKQHNFLLNLHPISPCYFRLPNGAHTIATFEGPVKL